ncbi:hypothetical protein WJX77_005336 [Trebouxia sp. C0004]
MQNREGQVPDFMRARQGSGSTSPSEGGSPQGEVATETMRHPLSLSPYKRRKLELQHRHTIIVAPNQEIMIDLWKKMAAKLPADVSAVTGETMGTGWSNKVAHQTVKIYNGAKGFRQEAAKRCKAELLSQWSGTDKPYSYGGEFNAEVGKQMLNNVKVRAMLEGKDIPQNGPKLDVVIKHYEEFVADMKAKQYLSHYVYPKDVAIPPSSLVWNTTGASLDSGFFLDSIGSIAALRMGYSAVAIDDCKRQVEGCTARIQRFAREELDAQKSNVRPAFVTVATPVCRCKPKKRKKPESDDASISPGDSQDSVRGTPEFSEFSEILIVVVL